MPSLFDTGIFSVTDAGTGAVGAGWKLNFYQTGTSTRLATYPTKADAVALTNANANPVVADAYGRLPAVWLLDQDYKGVLTDAAGVVKATRDPINTPLSAANISATGPGGSTMQDAITALSDAANTDNFITNLDGAIIHRMGDRVFVGGAVVNDGDYPNVTKDWYTTYEVAQGRGNGIIVSSQTAFLTNDYSGAAVAGVFAARTSNLGAGVGGAVGLEAHVVNNNTTTSHDAWSLYCEATRDEDGVAAAYAAEFDVRNKGNYYATTPSLQNAKQSVVVQIASGGALGSTGVADISAGINFRENPTKMGAGIVFGANAIRGTDGTTGYGNAILSGLRQKFTWMNSSDQATGSIWGETTLAANKTSVCMSDTGMLILGPSDTALALFRPVASTVNYLDFWGAATGGPVEISAGGSDTNIDLKLVPQGTGNVRFGTLTANADAPVTGYITIKDAGGTTRKLAVIA